MNDFIHWNILLRITHRQELAFCEVLWFANESYLVSIFSWDNLVINDHPDFNQQDSPWKHVPHHWNLTSIGSFASQMIKKIIQCCLCYCPEQTVEQRVALSVICEVTVISCDLWSHCYILYYLLCCLRARWFPTLDVSRCRQSLYPIFFGPQINEIQIVLRFAAYKRQIYPDRSGHDNPVPGKFGVELLSKTNKTLHFLPCQNICILYSIISEVVVINP